MSTPNINTNANCCNLKVNQFIHDLIIDDKTQFIFRADTQTRNPIIHFIEPYDVIKSKGLTGIWIPAFFNKSDVVEYTNWIDTESEYPFCDSKYSDGLGIGGFMHIKDPRFNNWYVSQDFKFEVDWLVKIDPKSCPDYERVVFFWYRYYKVDVEDNNDNRLIKGLDIYISDGEYAENPDGSFLVTENLKEDVKKISDQLAKIKKDDGSLLYQGKDTEREKIASILATGPQIDFVTEKLVGPGSLAPDEKDYRGIQYDFHNQLYKRDSYSRMIGFLIKMCGKRYSDIGTNNFIRTREDLFRKLSRKYGAKLSLDPEQTGRITSKFESRVGPNVSAGFDIKLYRSDKFKTAGYTFSTGFDNLKFTSVKTDKKAVGVGNNNQDIYSFYINDTLLCNTYVGDQKYLDAIRGVRDPEGNLIQKDYHGVFNICLKKIDFHGLGGVKVFHTGITPPLGCSFSLGGTPLPPIGATQEQLDLILPLEVKPFFIQDYIAKNGITLVNGIEHKRSPFFFSVTTEKNSRFRLGDIDLSYLRTESNPNCPPFITNRYCDCYITARDDPGYGGVTETNDTGGAIYVPSISTHNLPDMKYYGGLTAKEVSQYNIKPFNHPSPGTSLPKSHFLPHPPNTNTNIYTTPTECPISVTNCGERSFVYNIRYPTRLVLEYVGQFQQFELSWNGQTVKSEKIGYAGSICIDKKTAFPSEVTIKVTIPNKDEIIMYDGFNPQWTFNLSAKQMDYEKQNVLGDTVVQGGRGFFHPNSGWIPYYHENFNNYKNKTPLIPEHRIYTTGEYVRYDFIISDYETPVVDIDKRVCSTSIHSQKTVRIPDDMTLPVTVGIYGYVADELIIDGKVIEPNKYPALPNEDSNFAAECNSAHFVSYWFTSKNRSFTIAAGNNYEGSTPGYSLYVVYDATINNYAYNAESMYNKEFLPGFNFMCSYENLNKYQQYIIDNSEFIGIEKRDGSSCTYITSNWDLVRYNEKESLILENAPFSFINIDHFVKKGIPSGYALNDFQFEVVRNFNENKEPIPSKTIRISSDNSSSRIRAYFDDHNYKKEKIIIWNPTFTNGQELTIDQINNNTIIVQEDIKLDLIKGYLCKKDSSQSVMLYKPSYTRNDYISVGKWGNMTYGNNIEFAKKFFEYDKLTSVNRYNNNDIRDKTSPNTAFTWSAPFTVVNSSSQKGKDPISVPFMPLSRMITNTAESDGSRSGPYASSVSRYFSSDIKYHTLGINNEKYDPTVAVSGDQVISSGYVSNTEAYVYAGPYAGRGLLKVKLNTYQVPALVSVTWNGKKYTKFSFEITEDNQDGEYIYFDNIDKESPLPIYIKIEIINLLDDCFGRYNIPSVNITQFIFKAAYWNTNLIQRSRISYYPHQPVDIHYDITNARTIDPGSVVLNNTRVTPLLTNNDLIKEVSSDKGPYLDLNIFSQSSYDKPFLSESGTIYFEDFLLPKSKKYLDNMPVPYSTGLFWVDLPYKQNWDILTSKGIIFRAGRSYKILKSLSYSCDSNAEKCSQRYDQDICSFKFEVTEDELFDVLGLSEYDKENFEISTWVLPQDCHKINYCCHPADTDCLTQQQNAIYQCLFQNGEIDLPTPDSSIEFSNLRTCMGSCPSDTLSGHVKTNVSYYVIKVKKGLIPKILLQEDSLKFKFFPRNDIAQLNCVYEDIHIPTNLDWPKKFYGAGVPFYNIDGCGKECEYFVKPDYDFSSDYPPGQLIDLSSYFFDKSNIFGQKVEPEMPDSIKMHNEYIYRNYVNYPNKVSLPYYEYDQNSEMPFFINQTLTLRSDGCIKIPFDYSVPPSWREEKAFDLIINGQTFNFSLLRDLRGYVLKSNIFPDTILKENAFLDSRFEFEAYPGINYYNPPICGTEGVNKDCSDIVLDVPDAQILYCSDISNGNAYTKTCNICEACVCDAKLVTYQSEQDDCICPEGFNLGGDGYGSDTCVKTVPVYYLEYDQLIDCGTSPAFKRASYKLSQTTKTVTASPACFDPLPQPSQAEVDSFNAACSNLPHKTVTTTLTYQETKLIDKTNDYYFDGTYTSYQDDANKALGLVNTGLQLDCEKVACGIKCGGGADCLAGCQTIRDNKYLAAAQSASPYNQHIANTCDSCDTVRYSFFNSYSTVGVPFEALIKTIDDLYAANIIAGACPAAPPDECGNVSDCCDLQFTWKTNQLDKQIVDDATLGKYVIKRTIKKVTQTKCLEYADYCIEPSYGEYRRKVFYVRYRTAEPLKEEGCSDSISIFLNINIKYYPGVISITISSQNMPTGSIECVFNTIDKFKCPIIGFKNYANPKIRMCESIDSQISFCDIGRLVAPTEPEPPEILPA